MGILRPGEWISLARKEFSGPYRGTYVLLLLATAGALGLRLAGIDFGLPHRLTRPDESYVVDSALQILRDFTPRKFDYPTGYVNLVAVLLALYYGVGRLSGRFENTEDFVAEWYVDPSNFLLLDRLLSACLGAATVPLVYILGVRTLGRREGLVAAFLFSVAYLHVRDSHFGTTDSAFVFACLLALILIHRLNLSPGRGGFFAAAAAVGVAVSTKYNAVALAVPLGILCFAAPFDGKAGPRPRQTVRRVLLCGAGVLLGFLVATPYVLWNPGQFFADVAKLGSDKLGGTPHAGVEAGWGWSRHFSVSLWYGIGWPLLLASGAGLLLAWRRRARATVPVLVFAAVYWGLMATSPVVVVRYALPLVPVACLMAAVCVTTLESRVQGRWRPVVVAGSAALLMALPLYRSVRCDQLLLREDSRLALGEWITSNVPDGSSIGFVGDRAAHPPLRSTPGQIEAGRRYFVEKHGGEGRGMRRLADHVRKRSGPSYHRMITRRGIEGWTDWYQPSRVVDEDPRFIVLPDYPAYEEAYLRQGTGPWIERLLAGGYRLVLERRTWGEEAMVFDPQDLFFLPYAGLLNAQRPGPGYRVFARND